MARWSATRSREAALAGHQAMCERVRESLPVTDRRRGRDVPEPRAGWLTKAALYPITRIDCATSMGLCGTPLKSVTAAGSM